MKAIRELVLAGTALTVSVAAIDAAYAADLPTLSTYPALSSPEALGWTMDHASAEFGGQGFIEKPGTSRENSKAKFNQYGTLTNPVFLNFFDLGAQGYDYKYTFEALGQNVGTNNQDYEVDLYQPGQQYLNLGYYSVPNLRSNTAETLYYGAGSNNLFIPPLVVQQLYGGIYNGGTPATGAGNNSTVPVLNQTLGIPPGAPAVQPLGCFLPGQTGKLACKPGVTPVQTTVLENVHRINLGIQRDAGEVDYRWTPTPNWDFQASYSDEHRYGTQEEGMLFSTGTSTPLAQVPMPVDDYTQNASILGEYYGISPWGMKWNGILRYNASIYTDTINSFAAMSPFGGPGSLASGVPNCPIATTTKVANCYGEGLMGTEPNNASNAGMAELGVDLPGFVRNRYMGTFNYNAMTQNEAFIPMTINPGPYYVGTTSPKPYSLSPLQRSSLDGEIDTMLFNNVLTTQVLPNVQNKLNYRYYSYDNNTPALTLANWIVNDSAIATNGANTATTANVGNGSYAPHTTLFSSYTKQDAAEQMTWNPVSWGTVGGSLGWAAAPIAVLALTSMVGWRVGLSILGVLGLLLTIYLVVQAAALTVEGEPQRPSEAGASSPKLVLSGPILVCFGYFVLLAVATVALQVFLPSSLVSGIGISFELANSVLTCFLVGSALGMFAGGMIADRFERHELIVATGLLTVAIVSLSIGVLTVPIAALILCIAVAGFAWGCTTPSRDMLVRSAAPAGAMGTVVGFVYSGLDLGSAVTPPFLGFLLDHHLPRLIFVFTAGVLLIAISSAFAVGRNDAGRPVMCRPVVSAAARS